MQYDWILDALAEMKVSAKAYGFDDLAGQLDDAMLVAAAEMAARESGRNGAIAYRGTAPVRSGRKHETAAHI